MLEFCVLLEIKRICVAESHSNGTKEIEEEIERERTRQKSTVSGEI